jgi:hypothetical protein
LADWYLPVRGVPDEVKTDATQVRTDPGRRWRRRAGKPRRRVPDGGCNIASHLGHIRRGGAVNASGVTNAPHTAINWPWPTAIPADMFSSVTAWSAPSTTQVTLTVHNWHPSVAALPDSVPMFTSLVVWRWANHPPQLGGNEASNVYPCDQQTFYV